MFKIRYVLGPILGAKFHQNLKKCFMLMVEYQCTFLYNSLKSDWQRYIEIAVYYIEIGV